MQTITTYISFFRDGRIKAWLGLMVALVWVQVSHAQSWPGIALPKEVTAFDIGQQVSVNALPMQLQGFVSSLNPGKLAEVFRLKMGKPLVENVLDNKRILGRLQGEYYLSVQIEAAGMGSRGVAAVTHLKAGYDAQDQSRASREGWLLRLPSGSRLLSQMTSQDGSKHSQHIVFVNTQSEALNRDSLKGLLAEDGLSLEREGVPDDAASGKSSANIANSRVLFFKGQGKEAMATISKNNAGQTATVLNVITLLERIK